MERFFKILEWKTFVLRWVDLISGSPVNKFRNRVDKVTYPSHSTEPS